VLLTGLGDDLCGLLPPLLQAVAYHPPTVDLPAFPVVCLLVVHVEISSLSFPASLVLFWSSCPFCFVLVFSLLFIIQFFFYRGVSLPRGLCWFILGVEGILFGLPNVSQAGLEPHLVSVAHLFSQCNVAWRSFLLARGSGCGSFDFSRCFISAKCGSSISARFLESQTSHCLLLYPSHHLGYLITNFLDAMAY
jgi:hypothetical protein